MTSHREVRKTAKQAAAGGRAKQSKAKQSSAKQSKAEQSKAEQSKARQSKAKQGKAEQSKAASGRRRQRVTKGNSSTYDQVRTPYAWKLIWGKTNLGLPSLTVASWERSGGTSRHENAQQSTGNMFQNTTTCRNTTMSKSVP